MSEQTEHEHVIEAAKAVTDRASARALIDSLYIYGVAFHPEESFDNIVTSGTGGERTFTDEEARLLDQAMEKVVSLLDGQEMYDYSLEVILSDSDKELLEEVGIKWTMTGKRCVPVDEDGNLDYQAAIPKLLEHAGIAFQPADPEQGFYITGRGIQVWEHFESSHKGGAQMWAFGARDLDPENRPIPNSTRVTRSAYIFTQDIGRRLDRD